MMTRRITAGLAIIGFVSSGVRVIPGLPIFDASIIFLALIHVFAYCAEGLVTGEWPK